MTCVESLDNDLVQDLLELSSSDIQQELWSGCGQDYSSFEDVVERIFTDKKIASQLERGKVSEPLSSLLIRLHVHCSKVTELESSSPSSISNEMEAVRAISLTILLLSPKGRLAVHQKFGISPTH